MTVCIAASGVSLLSGDEPMPVVVMTADRMLTYGNRQEYEPFETKIFPLTDRIRVLLAGDTGRLLTVCRATEQRLAQVTDLSVELAAEALASEFAAERLRRAEQEILSPLGLTIASYLQNQSTFAPMFVDEIQNSLRGAILRAEAIVGGVDGTGAHLFVVRDPGVADCRDNVGFATIGIGADIASAEFMANSYGPSHPWVMALSFAYAAKRRAEQAPGVGLMTDLVIISPGRVQSYDEFSELAVFLRESFNARTEANLESARNDTRALFAFLEEQAKKTGDPVSSGFSPRNGQDTGEDVEIRSTEAARSDQAGDRRDD